MRATVTLALPEVGNFDVHALSMSEALRTRGIRNELTAGQWVVLANSPGLDDRIAANFASAMSTLAVAIDKYPDGFANLDELAARSPKLVTDLYELYRERFPDPFRAFYTDSPRRDAGATEARPAGVAAPEVPGAVSPSTQ